MRNLFVSTVAVLASISGGTHAAQLTVQWSTLTNDVAFPDITSIPGGGVYVASTPEIGAPSLRRYSEGGTQLWRVDAGDSSSRAQLVRTDSFGNAYLAGEAYTAMEGPRVGAGDTFLRKYDPNGVKLWGRQFGTTLFDKPIGVLVSSNGDSKVLNDPWATNYSVPPAGTSVELFHFAANGTQTARTAIPVAGNTYPGNTAYGSDTAVRASDGSIYSVFSHYFLNAPNNIGMRNYMSKTDAAGNVLWVKTMAQGSNIMSLAIDSADNLIVAAGSLSKFSSAGDLLWTSLLPNDGVYAVCTTPDGRIFAGGGHAISSALVREYTPAGDLLWTTDVPLSGRTLSIQSMTISNNRLYAAAQVVTGNTTTNNLIMSFGQVPEPSALISLVLPCVRRRRSS